MKLEVANFNIEILHHDPMVYVVERFLSDLTTFFLDVF